MNFYPNNRFSAAQQNTLQALVAKAWDSSAMAILGDSYFANAFTYSSSFRVFESGQNPFSALNQILGGPWDLVYDGSVTGTTSSDWLSTQLPGVLASSVDVVFVGFPTNDPDLIGNYATSVANLTSIYAQIKAAGKSIITYIGGNKAAWTGAQRGIAQDIGNWIQLQSRLNGWPCVDLFSAINDPATGKGTTIAAGTANAMLLSESAVWVHPAASGHLVASQLSQTNFAAIPSRPVNVNGGAAAAFYNGALNGNTGGLPDGFSSYTSGTPTATSITKGTRTDAPLRTTVQFTGTSDAAGSRQGMSTANISLTAVWSTGAKVLGQRATGTFGDQWVVTTAGTSSGTQPAAMAAASNIGDTVTDSGGVVWTRYKNIVPGTSKLTIRVEFDITSVSGADLGAQPVILVVFSGSVAYGGLRGNAPINATDPVQRWGFTKTRFPVIATPYQIPVPVGCTGIQVYIYQQWDIAGVTSTFIVRGIESRLD